MIVGVADTHAALWHLFDDARLSPAAADFIDQAVATRNQIAVSTISLVEVVYLAEKRRLPQTAYVELVQSLADPLHVFTEAALTTAIVASMRHVPRASVPDMPDRIIAATSAYFGVPLISRDRRILAADLQTIW